MSFEDQQYETARKKVKLKKSFYSHLTSYIIVGTFFFILNMTTSPNDIWFHFPMMGWGIGLAFHYIRVFGIPWVGSLNKSWEEQEIQKELYKMNRKTPNRNLLSENHEIDELDLDNRYPFDKKKEDNWEDFDNRDIGEIRKDFNEQFKG